MRIAIDFDGTIVSEETAYDDLETPIEFMPGAESALRLLAASHELILYSSRSNTAARLDWRRNPLWRNDATFNVAAWEAEKPLQEARYQQMLDFVDERLPGVFIYVDDGEQGKLSADLFLDDRALRMNGGWRSADWYVIEEVYGDHHGEAEAPDQRQEVHGRPDDRGAGAR